MTDSSETNLVTVTKRARFMLFFKLYWRSLIIFLSPFILMPIALVGTNKAYTCFYVFVLTAVYWITDAVHPTIAAMVPIALSIMAKTTGHSFIGEMTLRNDFFDCAGVMMIIIAMERSQLHRRAALHLLRIFGCSHYRLSFLMFFISMFLSMWFSSILTCGLMMPLMKAVLTELEKMGILEIYETVGKAEQRYYNHGESKPSPTGFTIFYFLGIAYSSSIGELATLASSQTNQLYKIYCEKIFPNGPKIDFPILMLLNLPGVIMMETVLYFWMNFYFVGMFRSHASLEISMTEEEAQYVKTILSVYLKKLEKVSTYEWVVILVIVLSALLQTTVSTVHVDSEDLLNSYSNLRIEIFSPCLFPVLLLFILPKNGDFLTFFSKRSDSNRLLLQNPCKKCLSWAEVRDNMHWGVLMVIAGSTTLFESLQHSRMTDELEQFLLLFKKRSPTALILLLAAVCKVLTELAPGACVASVLLPSVARLSILCKLNPHYLMLAASHSASLPFHLVTGAPVNAMVASYVHIPPFKMLWGGLVPSMCALAVSWFTAAGWCAAIMPDEVVSPAWNVGKAFKLDPDQIIK